MLRCLFVEVRLPDRLRSGLQQEPSPIIPDPGLGPVRAVWFALAEIVESLTGQHVPQRSIRWELNSPKILAADKLES